MKRKRFKKIAYNNNYDKNYLKRSLNLVYQLRKVVAAKCCNTKLSGPNYNYMLSIKSNQYYIPQPNRSPCKSHVSSSL